MFLDAVGVDREGCHEARFVSVGCSQSLFACGLTGHRLPVPVQATFPGHKWLQGLHQLGL